MKKDKEIGVFDLVIFGGDGDLALRKIFPAMYFRVHERQVEDGNRILAIARNQHTDASFRDLLEKSIRKHVSKVNEASLKRLLAMVHYIADDVTSPQGNGQVTEWLNERTDCIRAFYLATPASIYAAICEYLAERKLINAQSRIVLEKPLGRDLASSEEVNEHVGRFFKEEQIYRIDHYLGKETVQNLMVLRFANNIFERGWNARDIENIQITVSESIGVGSRGAYYDEYGALRDMVQNHLLQLLCLIAMEPPVALDADLVRDEKLKVLKALRAYKPEMIKTHTVKGQFTRGSTTEGELPSYLEEIEKFNSDTETFVALKAYVDNWRWGGMPFYLRTGKRMPHRYSEIVINFKPVPHNIFPEGKRLANNKLTIRLQPEERIELEQMVKIPGPGGYRYKPFSLELDYADHFNQRFPDAYERLLMDVIRGNQTLFMRRDEVRASWEWVESILKGWEKSNMPNILYEAGTWGPANKIMDRNHSWVKSRHVIREQENPSK